MTKELIQVGKLTGGKYDYSSRVYSPEGVCPTLTAAAGIGGGMQVKILENTTIRVPEATKKGFAEATIGDSINLAHPNSKTRRGRVGKGVASTLLTSCEQVAVTKSRVRRLTPREYWRLMGFADEDFDKARPVTSDTQLYKQAGNSIVVNVLEAVLKELLR